MWLDSAFSESNLTQIYSRLYGAKLSNLDFVRINLTSNLPPKQVLQIYSKRSFLNKQLLRNVILPLAVLLLVALFKFIIPDNSAAPKQNQPQSEFRGNGAGKNVAAVPTANVVKDGIYTSKDEVAAYIYRFGELPRNFITKKEALALGWDAKSGNLWQVTDKKSIGGDRFSNREKRLPEASGRKWFECDIGYGGGRRGAQRIVFSNDGLIYYTPDHYENFYLLFDRRQQ